jgi:hypothetical protein
MRGFPITPLFVSEPGAVLDAKIAIRQILVLDSGVRIANVIALVNVLIDQLGVPPIELTRDALRFSASPIRAAP